jgi:GTPase SAR1 family protein
MELPALLYTKPVRVCDKCHLKLQRIESKEPISTGSLKLVVLGQSGVGKTVLINKFILGSFAENSIPTIGANFLSKTMVSADGKVSR